MDTLPTTGGLNAFYITILVAVALIALVTWYIVWKGRPLRGQHVFRASQLSPEPAARAGGDHPIERDPIHAAVRL